MVDGAAPVAAATAGQMAAKPSPPANNWLDKIKQWSGDRKGKGKGRRGGKGKGKSKGAKPKVVNLFANTEKKEGAANKPKLFKQKKRKSSPSKTAAQPTKQS